MKKIYIVLNIFFWMSILNYSALLAQPNVGSVSSSSMGTAVGEFTGTLNLNFPLASVSNGNVGAGLSLGYVGTGYKPNSPSSEVGMDWYMSSGFSVTRQVMHLFDEEIIAIQENPLQYTFAGDGTGDNYNFGRISNNIDDGELDLYTFTGFGQNVNFSINKNTGIVFIITKTELKIIPIMDVDMLKVDMFEVINIDGTKIKLIPNQQILKGWFYYTTVWLPSQIEAYDIESNKIDYIYDNNFRSYQFQGLDSEPVKGLNKRLLSMRSFNDTINLTYLERFDITSAGSNGVQGKLDQVFYKNDNLCYYYQLQSDYFGATGTNRHQTRLNSIQKKSCDNTITEPAVEFNYVDITNIVVKSWTGIDHWGFRNQHSSNPADNMIPTQFGGGANRSIDTTRVKGGMLSSVKDINGKLTTITYEPHRISVSPSTVNAGFKYL